MNLLKPAHSRYCRRLVPATGLLLLGFFGLVPLRGQNPDDLVDKSPFLPEGWGREGTASGQAQQNAAAQAIQQSQLDFQGVFTLNGETWVNIFDKRQGKGLWIRVGDRGAPLPVTRYDSQQETVMVAVPSGPISLPFKKPTNKTIPVAFAPTPQISRPTANSGETNAASGPGARDSNRRLAYRPVIRRRIIGGDENAAIPARRVPGSTGGGAGSTGGGNPGAVAPPTNEDVSNRSGRPNMQNRDDNNSTRADLPEGIPAELIPILRGNQ